MNAYYEKWIWIELIGFDHNEKDFGVKAYLDKCGFIPKGMALLLFSPDFVHSHRGMDTEGVLPYEICSYGGRPYGKERNRQEWTNYQLKGLIANLQKYGIEVYCSFFDLFRVDDPAKLRETEWCARHPELYEMNKNGTAFKYINPLKRFKDGTYYEDLFIQDLMKVMVDYNFDGYHGADGYTSPRKNIALVDYSDDMIEQFLLYSGVVLDKALMIVCDQMPEEMIKRANWIWKHQRSEWIRFNANRWGELWGKIIPALHKEGKKAYLNTAWTRDPFEALYRYGVDYQQLAETGIDGFIVESVAASLSAGAGETDYELGTEFMAMILTIKAYVPDKKLICLNAIQDTQEQWDALSHAPTVLERDIYSFSNLYLINSDGVNRCSTGFMACLGDGISKDGWNWITNRWDLGYRGHPQKIIGVSMVWSDQALHNSVEEYIEYRNWTTHKYMYELLEHGAPLHSVVDVKDLLRTSGPILIGNFNLFPEEELNRIISYRGGSSIIIGKMTKPIQQVFATNHVMVEMELNQIFCLHRNGDGETVQVFLMDQVRDGHSLLMDKVKVDQDDGEVKWLESLYFNPVSDEFLLKCAKTLIEISGTPTIERNNDYIFIEVLEMNADTWRVMIRNTHINYKSAFIDIGREIVKMNILTEFPGIPVKHKDTKFNLYVPGRGMVIVEVHF